MGEKEREKREEKGMWKRGEQEGKKRHKRDNNWKKKEGQ